MTLANIIFLRLYIFINVEVLSNICKKISVKIEVKYANYLKKISIGTVNWKFKINNNKLI